MALASLGIAFCTGCGDSSPQSWEGGRSQSSTERKTTAVAEPANNDEETTGEPNGSRKSTNPHAGMPMMAGGGSDAELDNNGKLDIETVHFTVPKSWVRKSPMMPDIIQAEYRITKAEGDKADGRLTVSMAGGTLDSNVTRWKGQFSKLDKEGQETIDADGVKITLVDLAGTFDDSAMGPMAPPTSRPDYRMFGAIFQLPGERGLHFIKCYGPAKTIGAQADEFKNFLKSLKVDK